MIESDLLIAFSTGLDIVLYTRMPAHAVAALSFGVASMTDGGVTRLLSVPLGFLVDGGEELVFGFAARLPAGLDAESNLAGRVCWATSSDEAENGWMAQLLERLISLPHSPDDNGAG